MRACVPTWPTCQRACVPKGVPVFRKLLLQNTKGNFYILLLYIAIIYFVSINLLPVCGKVFERLLHNNMFSFFSENDLISPKQPGFRPGDSCTNQLLSIAHEILSAFDDGHQVRGVFLDTSKAFDRVWHEGLLFKLRQNGISGELITLIKDFLSCVKWSTFFMGRCQSGRTSRINYWSFTIFDLHERFA